MIRRIATSKSAYFEQAETIEGGQPRPRAVNKTLEGFSGVTGGSGSLVQQSPGVLARMGCGNGHPPRSGASRSVRVHGRVVSKLAMSEARDCPPHQLNDAFCWLRLQASILVANYRKYLSNDKKVVAAFVISLVEKCCGRVECAASKRCSFLLSARFHASGGILACPRTKDSFFRLVG
jgi:hypothetical protein